MAVLTARELLSLQLWRHKVSREEPIKVYEIERKELFRNAHRIWGVLYGARQASGKTQHHFCPVG